VISNRNSRLRAGDTHSLTDGNAQRIHFRRSYVGCRYSKAATEAVREAGANWIGTLF